MTDRTPTDKTSTENTSTNDAVTSAARPRRAIIAGIAGALVLCGAGAVALGHGDDTLMLTPVQPTPIAALQASGAIGVTGSVAEIYGKAFIIQDATGRALVETGPGGEGGPLVAKGEAVQVQGRFSDGVLHAAMLTHADGKRIVLGPVGPRGPHGLDRLRDRIGLGPHPDLAGLTALVQSAGYTDVRVAGRGPRHLDIVARDSGGKDKDLHVDFDGRISDADAF